MIEDGADLLFTCGCLGMLLLLGGLAVGALLATASQGLTVGSILVFVLLGIGAWFVRSRRSR